LSGVAQSQRRRRSSGPRHRKRLVALVGICITLAAGVSCAAQPSKSAGTLGTNFKRLYAAKSAFNQPIPAGAAIDPRSDAYVAKLAQAGGGHGLFVALQRWTVPVYYAKASTPRTNVRLTASWRVADWMLRVPIPGNAAPDPSSDGHMTILDRATGCEFDFYQARHENGGWSAGWGNSLRLAGKGVYSHGFSARGSGFANLAGVIWPKELRDGTIRHALMFSYPDTSSRGAVGPATETDGESTDADALPEGARLRLDPSLDLRKLGLSPAAYTIGRALQRYGMYLGDTGGSVTLYAVNRQSYSGNPYKGFSASAYGDLSKIPLNRFRVLRLGTVRSSSSLQSRARLVRSGCGRLR
jgi:hypothetical protein